MFNGYNDSALISYEFNQEREKKLDNVSKYSYGHDGGVQSTPTHPSNRQSEFWSAKPNFVGIPNVVKCNCTGCYPTTETQSYQVQSTRHRPWLPKTYPVPVNGSNECKLPAYQWDNALNHMSESNVAYGQENGGKHSYYRQFQTPSQPSVIISANKQRSEMGFQNGIRQPVMCTPSYDLTKIVNGRSFYDEDKYSIGAHTVNQIPRLPVEPYSKVVPSNLNQNRVPSTGHRKENSSQCDYYTNTKLFPENCHSGLSSIDLKNSGINVDYSYFNRDTDFCRNNYTETKRNTGISQNRKDCSVTQANLEQYFGRTKHPDNMKGCEMFYPNFDKNQMESCIPRIENEVINRTARSVTVCNELRYADEKPQMFPYQNSSACRNYVRPDYPQFNSQWIPAYRESDQNQFRTLPHQLQSCDQQSQGSNGCVVDPLKSNLDKTQSYSRAQFIADAQPKHNYIETIRSEELTKNGTNKISPLRLLRKKKLATAPQEPSSVTTTSEAPMLDVRKFWSTWAEEEDENVSPAQMVVLDCQNIDPEQAKLLNFYETDPPNHINLENVLKNSDWAKENIENVKASEQLVDPKKQVEVSKQIEPVNKNADKVISELDAFNTSPKKSRLHEHRKKKEEVMDKWTEKKFDFLKRSEESKTAEMIRYEEEKKRIFEKRLSFQQIGANSTEKSQDTLRSEGNSESNSPKEIISDLPTSEYRRNKFLDYSEVIVNGCKSNQKIENLAAEQSTKAIVKKEPDIKKEADSSLEMNDILKKITEIDFEEMKFEGDAEPSKKTKKTKKKKSDQMETDARTDLKLEAVSKPTIKFSIQKSHDLKISFKVLNKKYEEEVQSEETKPIEDANTELITLKYKSIQNGGSDSKKKKGNLRRKKLAPAHKIKKNKYAMKERDPLAEDEAKTYPIDDFQVQETVDSAKIKLTFKRHKTNLETEYKIDSDCLTMGCEDEKNFEVIENKHKKKSKKAKKHKILTPPGIDSSHLERKSLEQRSAAVCGSEDIQEKNLELVKEHSEKSSTSHIPPSTNEEETQVNPFEMSLHEKRLCELTVQTPAAEDSTCKIECEEQLDVIVNCDEASVSDDKYDKFLADETAGRVFSKSSENEKTKEENQEISLDFIKAINSSDIETNSETEKTEEIENRDVNEQRNKSGEAVTESTNENHSILESSYDLKENIACLEIKSDLMPVSFDKRNAILESDSDKNVTAEIGKETFCENVPPKWLMDSQDILTPETNPENLLSSKLEENNFEECDSLKEKIEDFELDLGRNVEPEILKVVHSESKIELEDVFTKIADLRCSKNHLEYLETKEKNEPKLDNLELDKAKDKEHSESSEVEPNNLLLLNENSHQLETADCARLSNSGEGDNLAGTGVVIVEEKDLSIENADIFDGVSSSNPGLENQCIDTRKIVNEEFKTSVEDETKAGGLIGEEEKTFFIESDFDNSVNLEKQDELYEPHSVKIHDRKYSCESRVENEIMESDISTTKFEESCAELIRGDSFTEPELIDFESHLLNRKCDENKAEREAVDLKNENQGPELINVENMSASSDIYNLIHIPGHIREAAQEMEVICNSENLSSNECQTTEFANRTQIDEYEKSKEDLINIDEIEKNEPDIEFDLSACKNLNVKASNEMKNCSEFPKEQTQSTELPETSHFRLAFFDDVEDTNTDEICNKEPDNFISDENKFKVVTCFEDSKENHAQTDLEKNDVEDKQSERIFSNDKLTSFMKPQENTILMENRDQPDFSDFASLIDHSQKNSLTDKKETTLREIDYAKNSSPHLKEFGCSSSQVNSSPESELEDGEILDGSSNDSKLSEQTFSFNKRKTLEFKIQKPNRRHSFYFCNTDSSTSSYWCQKRFKKSKSCPPRFEDSSFKSQLDILVKDIPLPVGPPPLGSCYNSWKANREAKVIEEAKDKLDQISVVKMLEKKESIGESPSGSPFGAIEIQNCRNPSPPRSDALGTHRSKIRFTLMKRNRFSKVNLHSEKPKIFQKLDFTEKFEMKVLVPAKNSEQENSKIIKKPEAEVDKTAEKQDVKFNKTTENPNLEDLEISKKFFPKDAELEETDENVLKHAEKMEVVESVEKPEINVLESLQESELKVELSEIVEPEAIDPIENLELEVIETNININNETGTDANKIRTPDFVLDAVEDIRECQIAEVPNTSPIQTDGKDQKSDLEVESLCEDASVEIVDVMNDFMRTEFYEDIPTSEDLPNDNSVEDEKVSDDKFRSIMQNCLENAKKFLNVGNLKLFSCSVDDLLELDNQENEPANHISRDVLLTSCEDTNDDLGLNEKFQPVDISMEFIPSDVCPEILPVDNWPYLEEEVPSSPLKSNETDLILENTISEVFPNRKRVVDESENYKRFQQKSPVEDEEKLCSKIATHRLTTIEGCNSFLSYTKFNGIDKPSESLKCRLSLEKLTKNGLEFVCPQGEFTRKIKSVHPKKKLNYKSPLWQPKVMLIRISENEMKRLKKTKTRSRSAENLNSLPAVKKLKSDHRNNNGMEDEVILPIPRDDSIKELSSSPHIKKQKPRFRNLHTKRKPEQEQTQPKGVGTPLRELFTESDENDKNKIEKTKSNSKITELELKCESKSDRHSSKYHFHKDKHDRQERRRESDREHHRHKEKRKHERSKHEDGKRRKSYNSNDERKRSLSKTSDGNKEANLKEVWVCDVCGFDDASERVSHIKNHPFHCQSCHLAFKAETYFTDHLTEMHKDIRNQHHCLLCELSFDTEEEYQRHLETREHTHLEAVEKNTINTLFTLLTGAPCPVLGRAEMKPEWLPNQPGTVHFYHQATPLSLALQYLKMHRDLTSYSEVSHVHPN